MRPPDSLSKFRASQGDVVISEQKKPSPAPRISFPAPSFLPSLLPVNSWAPRTKRYRLTLSKSVRDLTKSYLTWVILLALAIDVLAIALEPALLLLHGAPARAAAASLMAAFGFSILFSMAAAMPIAAVYTFARYLGRLPAPWKYTWPLPLVALAWLVVDDVAPHPFVTVQVRIAARAMLFVFLAGVMLLATVVARLRSPRNRVLAGVLLGASMFGVYSFLPTTVHREPRDVVWLCIVLSAVAIFYPLRRQLVESSHDEVSRSFGLLCALSCVGALASQVAPNWRVYARDDGRFAERLGRFCRMIIDLDGDGFSAVFGGMDCDDWDPARNPIVAELPDGIDRNCNGVTRPPVPTDTDRGLASPVGSPDVAPGEVDRVVLITLDCFRSDVLRPDVTPQLLRLAGRGVTFTKLYAGGSRTTMSLPLIMRGAYKATPLATILKGRGVSSTAVFGYKHGTLGDNAFQGFQVVKLPEQNDKRFRASQVTDMALDDLRVPEHRQGHVLWVHYFDAHGPRNRAVLPPDVPRFGPLAYEDAESGLYLSELAYDDREVGRLLEGIAATGDLAKTAILVSGDHGEGFGLHGEYEHGQSPFDDIIHVPGIFVGPGIAPGTYEHVASHRDIAATIVGAFGAVTDNPDVETFGRSWWRLRAAPGARLHDFVITYTTSTHVQSWPDAPVVVRTDDEAKLSVNYMDGITRYYLLHSPEAERIEVGPEHRLEVARARRELEVYRDSDSSPP